MKAIEVAAGNLQGVLLKTPLLENEHLNQKLGGRVLVKAECLQRTGSFKARGAWNWLSSLGDPGSIPGVMALSSGNHGQAVAWAAQRLNINPVVVLIPEDAPRAKHERILAWGAEIVTYDRRTVNREALIATWVGKRGFVQVPAFDDRRIMAAAGTIALEALTQAEDLGAQPQMMLVPCSGGGLSGGCAAALAGTGVTLWAVEPQGYDDMGRSLAAGRRLGNHGTPDTICDALLSPIPGELGFAVNHERGTHAAVASDAAVREAMACLAEYFGLIVEPGGAIALAALLENQIPLHERTAIVVVSGSNVDTSLLQEVLSSRFTSAIVERGG
jgi:threonine dehydratase